MKQRIQGIIIGVLVTALLSGGVIIAAFTTIWKDIRVAYDNYIIVIDGVTFETRDVTGVIEPFSYNGWLYAPFEHIANALGMHSQWDGRANTLFLITPEPPPPPAPQVTYFFENINAYEVPGWGYSYKQNVSFTSLGDLYTHGLTFRLAFPGVTAYGNELSFISKYNLRGQYKVIRGMLGYVDGTGTGNPKGGTFSIYLDDILYKEYPLTVTMLATDVVIDVVGVQVMQIRIDYVHQGSNETYGFGNVIIE
jgi:hypothetical protein